MKLHKPLLALAAAVAAVLSTAASANVIVDVSLDTSSLAGNSGSPFVLDLQLNDGSGTSDANNTAVVTQLSFGTGSAVGVPQVGGGATASAGTVTLADSGFVNFFDQSFTPGSKLSFDLNLTTNVDAGPTPDEFSMSLFDAAGNMIPTTGLLSAFLVIDIDSNAPTIQTFAGSGDFAAIGAPIVGPIAPPGGSAPEPGTVALLGLAGIGLLRTRRKPRD